MGSHVPRIRGSITSDEMAGRMRDAGYAEWEIAEEIDQRIWAEKTVRGNTDQLKTKNRLDIEPNRIDAERNAAMDDMKDDLADAHLADALRLVRADIEHDVHESIDFGASTLQVKDRQEQLAALDQAIALGVTLRPDPETGGVKAYDVRGNDLGYGASDAQAFAEELPRSIDDLAADATRYFFDEEYANVREMFNDDSARFDAALDRAESSARAERGEQPARAADRSNEIDAIR